MRSVSAPDESLREALCAWLEGADASPTPGQSIAAAEAWTALAEPLLEGLDAATLAVALSETMPVDGRDAILAHPFAGAQMEAAEDFLTLATAAAPRGLVEAARRLLDPGSNVATLPRRTTSAQPQTFRLRAAASARPDQAVLCKSDSGIWMLEVFVARHSEEGASASLLLSVDPDYRASYEGLRAKVFVTVEGVERILAEADVRNGELYSGISLEGLDLYARDAISVVFAPAPDDNAS
jgi:hypothetical protein